MWALAASGEAAAACSRLRLRSLLGGEERGMASLGFLIIGAGLWIGFWAAA